MTTRFYLHVATAILIAFTAITASAQSRNRQQLRVSIPFAFNVGNTALPAGDYSVSVVNPSSDRPVLQIASRNGESTTMVQTSDVSGWANSKAKLAFRHYGNQYFLAQVWMASEATGLATPNSNLERKLRQQLGKAAKQVEMVAVNAQ